MIRFFYKFYLFYLDDALKLTLDVVFPRPEGTKYTENYSFGNYVDSKNIWLYNFIARIYN